MGRALRRKPLKHAARISSAYANGRSIAVDTGFLQMRGHDLETKLKARFAGLGRYRKEIELKMAVLNNVLDDLPGLVPADILTLLKAIQMARTGE